MSEFGPRGGIESREPPEQELLAPNGELGALFDFIVRHHSGSGLTVKNLWSALQESIRVNFHHAGISANVNLADFNYAEAEGKGDGSYFFIVNVKGARWKSEKRIRLSFRKYKGTGGVEVLSPVFFLLPSGRRGYLGRNRSRARTATSHPLTARAVAPPEAPTIKPPRLIAKQAESLPPELSKPVHLREIPWTEYEVGILPALSPTILNAHKFDFHGYTAAPQNGRGPAKKFYCDTLVTCGLARGDEKIQTDGVYIGIDGCRRGGNGSNQFQLESPEDVELYRLHLDIPPELLATFECGENPTGLTTESVAVAWSEATRLADNQTGDTALRELQINYDLPFDPQQDSLARQRARVVGVMMADAIRRKRKLKMLVQEMVRAGSVAANMTENQISEKLKDRRRRIPESSFIG